MEKIWEIKKNITVQKELSDAALNPIVAKLLVQRGIDTVEKINAFLNPLKMKITDPAVFCDMEKCVKRIVEAIESKEKIIVYGDFDCDGVTSTAILLTTLKFLGANAGYYVPVREYENHGLNTKALVKLIAKEKAKLFITVDCGISDIEQVNFINSFKAQVIITDHHEAPDELPDAFGILNPKAMNSLDKDLPIETIESLNCLAGAGVAFKLACGLLKHYEKYDFAQELLPLVALGTIADVVPLLGENRSFVASGLELISKGKNPGIQKLLETAGYKADAGVTSENIAFGAAPRINAAGRLDTVESALVLLTSQNSSQISVCAQTLNNYNKIRQELSDTIFSEALEQISKEPLKNSIILFNKDWHIGIIGIVASRLAERFFRPVFLMTRDDNTGFVRCSARSIKGIHLHRLLSAEKELFEGFGGHSMAAGLYFDPKKHSFEDVKETLTKAIDDLVKDENIKQVVEIDMELDSDDITYNLIEGLNKLEPFGACNPSPVFAVKNLIFKEQNVMGSSKNHLKIFCEDEKKRCFECVWWGHEKLNLKQGERFDVVCSLKINNFNNNKTIQLDLQDFKSDAVKEDTQVYKVLDHRKKTGIFDQICDYLQTTKLKTAVFSEDSEISAELSKYALLGERLCDRVNISSCRQIMFFDYPPNFSVLKNIMDKSGAKIFHFMKYENKKIDVEALVKRVSGMFKYAFNNRDGQIKISEMACFLGVSQEVPEICADIFESLGMISVLSKNNDFMKIKFLGAVEFAKIKNHELYDTLCDELQKINDYRRTLCEADLDEVFAFDAK